MYLFFLIGLILVSIMLVFFILLQPGKGLNNLTYLNSQTHVNLFRSMNRNGFITNLISVLAGFFLVISIVLCNINTHRVKKDFFWTDAEKNINSSHHTSDTHNKEMVK